MAAVSGGKANEGGKLASAKQVLSLATKLPFHHHLHHPPKTTQEYGDIEWKDIVDRGKILRNEPDRGSLETRRRSLSDSDVPLLSPKSPKSPNRRVVFDLRNSRNVVKDFTLYEEDEEEEEEEEEGEDALNMSGFILYEEGADAEHEGTYGSNRDEGFLVNAILPSGERVTVSITVCCLHTNLKQIIIFRL